MNAITTTIGTRESTDWLPYPRRESRFVATPTGVAWRMVKEADITAGDLVLEPSAGYGPIVTAAAEAGATVDAVEICPSRARILEQLGKTRCIQVRDFLKVPAAPAYHAVLMAPPTRLGEDVRHIVHALGFLKQGGRLAAVIPDGFASRTDQDGVAFRDLLVELDGEVQQVPDGIFEAGNTCLVVVALANRDARKSVEYFRSLILS